MLDSALKLDSPQRAAYLDEACAGDEALRLEVESLLLAHDRAGSFLNTPPVEVAAEVLATEQRKSLLGQRIGPFTIESFVGSGGMGEVYRATDTRLGRIVAIKFLPARFSRNRELSQRLEREARAISRLNHPNICTLFDIGHHDGADYLVMEHLEGETLEKRLSRGAVPPDEALRYSIQIAAALQAAHREGITHRDIKPGNIMLVKGCCKLLDFGLARLSAPAGPESFPSAPTGDSLRTPHGTILGTVQYMAPEQLEGEEVDTRTDIFALGAVIYEMLTGRRAFEGKSQASLIARIMSSEPPPISALQPVAPPALDHVVRRCLAKDPEERWQTALDVRKELEWIAESEATPAESSPPGRVGMNRRAWVATAIGSMAAFAAGAVLLRRRNDPSDTQPQRFFIPLPSGVSWAPAYYGGPAISPDGTRIVFVANRNGQPQLLMWLKSIEDVEPQPLAGTDGAFHPFWAPDSTRIGFFSGGQLRAMDITDGSVRTLCKVDENPRDNQGKGGTWNAHGDIVFATTRTEPLYRVSDLGGDPRRVTTLVNEESHRWPCFLPDGRRFIYLARHGAGAVWAGSLDSDEKVLVMRDHDSSVIYVPPGYLLFARDGSVMTHKFDASNLKVEGEAYRVTGPVTVDANINRALFSASTDGTLVLYDNSAGGRQLVQFDRTGTVLRKLSESKHFLGLQLSPDDRKIAYTVTPEPDALNSAALVVMDEKTEESKVAAQVPFTGSPVFSNNGRHIFFSGRPSTLTQGPKKIYRVPLDDLDKPEVFLEDEGFHLNPLDVSSDGRTLLIGAWAYRIASARFQLWRVHLTSDGKPEQIVKAREKAFNEGGAQLSPDGRWLAYVSDENGKEEVFVREFLTERNRTRVSAKEGGRFPAWTRNTEIVYVTPNQTLVPVKLTLGESITATPGMGIKMPIGTMMEQGVDIAVGGRGRFWAMSADAATFYMLMTRSVPRTSVVTNWTAVLKR